MNTSNLGDILLNALAKSARVFADSIEAEAQVIPSSRLRGMDSGGRTTFDPVTEDPPKKASPEGTREERLMAYLTYLGAVLLINERENRGATRAEVRKYAMKAGYANARAVNGFSNGDKPNTESRTDGRWVIQNGKAWLKELQETLGTYLPNVNRESD